MAKRKSELNSKSLLVVVFLVLVLVVVAYLLTSGKLALYKSGASSIYTVPKVQIVGGSNNNRAQVVGGSNQIKATPKITIPVVLPKVTPKPTSKPVATPRTIRAY